MIRRRFVHGMVFALCLLAAMPLTAQTSWGELRPGPHAVGFQSHIELDGGRTYRTAFDDGATYGWSGLEDDKSARPVLVSHWYPAQADGLPPAMPYGRYFELGTGSPPSTSAVERFARALAAYAADVSCTELVGKPVAELDEVERAAWERFLSSPTRAHPDAPQQTGPFPLVIYHSGAGSSYEDNSVFCEYLASHGYVVLGSAYPAADGSGFGIDSGDGSVRDMELLTRLASSMDHVDWARIAFGGHSAGAQVTLRALLRPDCPADAAFLFDTTADYYSLAIPNFAYLTEPVLAQPLAFTRPMLVTAGPEASFQMCDQLVDCERTYLTYPELGHNEFIAQGVLRLRVQSWLLAAQDGDGDGDGERAREVERLPEVSRLFVSLCDATRAYLDRELKGDAQGFESVVALAARQRLGGREPCVELAPRGQAGPPAYAADSDRPPTPRQLLPLLQRVGMPGLLEILAAHADDLPRSPIYESGMVMGSVLYDLVASDRLDDARSLHAWLLTEDLDGLGTLGFLAFMNRLVGKPGRALEVLEVALSIDPEHERCLEELAALAEAADTGD